MSDNPYAAPKAHVEDVPSALPDGDFIPEGRAVAAGNGWRWLADGWAFTGLQRGTFIGVFLLIGVLLFAINLVPFLGAIAGALLMPALTGGIWLGCDALRHGQPLEVGHLFAAFHSHGRKLFALGGLSLAVAVLFMLIGALIFGSSVGLFMLGAGQPSPEELSTAFSGVLLGVLVIIALSIPWYMALYFATPLIVLADFDVVPALKTSFAACLKNVVPFLVWSLAFFVLSILATIPLALGWLLLGPVMLASIYLSYRDIFYAA